MEKIQKSLERFFRLTAEFVYQYPRRVLLLVFVVVALLLSQLPKLTMDTSNQGFFRKDSDIILNYQSFREQYGQENVIVISVAPPAVFDFDFLQKLKTFHKDLESSVPHLHEVTSLLNARNTRGEGDEREHFVSGNG